MERRSYTTMGGSGGFQRARLHFSMRSCACISTRASEFETIHCSVQDLRALAHQPQPRSLFEGVTYGMAPIGWPRAYAIDASGEVERGDDVNGDVETLDRRPGIIACAVRYEGVRSVHSKGL